MKVHLINITNNVLTFLNAAKILLFMLPMLPIIQINIMSGAILNLLCPLHFC